MGGRQRLRVPLYVSKTESQHVSCCRGHLQDLSSLGGWAPMYNLASFIDKGAFRAPLEKILLKPFEYSTPKATRKVILLLKRF